MKVWPESDWIPISALQHYSYCPRQCALIHVEQTFDENLYTLRGQAAHARVDSGETTLEAGVRVERALPLWSETYGLTGIADVVEFYGTIPFPVEYKYGSRHQREHDDIQLCVQALCLEEMLKHPVSKGAIYHISSRRRREVTFTPELRRLTVEVLGKVRSVFRQRRLPPPVNDARCRHCSLVDSCLPVPLRDDERLTRLRHDLLGFGGSR